MQSSTSHRTKRFEVNGASLIDLKAEISRRQIEVKAKASNVPNVSTPVLKRSGGGGISGLLKRPVSPPHKIQKSADNTQAEKSAEEQAAWDAARRKLEAKARLYDALKQAAAAGTAKFDDREDDKAPLVDFERKAMEVGTDSSDDDGDKNRRNNRIVRTLPVLNTEPVNIPDGPVTYAHLRRGEVRDHGTGFYAFSEDAEQRAAEQAALRDLRQQTEQARERVEVERVKRSVAMGRRLAQLRARKGLSDVATVAANLLKENKESPSSPQITDIPPPSSPHSQSGLVGEQLGSDDLDIASMLRRLRDEAEAKQAAKNSSSSVEVIVQSARKESTLPRPPNMPKNRIMREWDRGKTFVQTFESPQSSSNRQISRYTASKRRVDTNKDEERVPEFAPPKFY
ncbi:unnamed protein product [Hymenolepis diminuta]|uniref:Pre-mRNA-processing protein 45 n=1 Tax=Hymenolepis diminuta TaxID=6216 RepID=A0A0R3SQC8_HYMDI|nr:unnamed protein product [Hymenolepis diminuta]VUZ40829.1 unnamed protein product [Hymenolepis diminuta]